MPPLALLVMILYCTECNQMSQFRFKQIENILVFGNVSDDLNERRVPRSNPKFDDVSLLANWRDQNYVTLLTFTNPGSSHGMLEKAGSFPATSPSAHTPTSFILIALVAHKYLCLRCLKT